MATSLTLQNDPTLQQGYLKVNGSTAATLTTSGIQVPQATIGSLNGILKATSGVVSNATTSDLGSLGSLTLATAQTASGTSVNFNNIPSWAKRITIMLSGVSTNGSSVIEIRVGSGSVANSGYQAQSWQNGNPTATGYSTSGFPVSWVNAATRTYIGLYFIYQLGSSNTYLLSGQGIYDPTNGTRVATNGSISLSGALDRITITTVNGTDSFDAGIINISYEG